MLVWFVMGQLNRMLISFSHATRLLLFGVLFDPGLVFPSQVSAHVKTGSVGSIRGMLPKTKSLVLIPSLRLLIGLFGVLETISLSTLTL